MELFQIYHHWALIGQEQKQYRKKAPHWSRALCPLPAHAKQGENSCLPEQRKNLSIFAFKKFKENFPPVVAGFRVTVCLGWSSALAD